MLVKDCQTFSRNTQLAHDQEQIQEVNEHQPLQKARAEQKTEIKKHSQTSVLQIEKRKELAHPKYSQRILI